MSELLQLEWTSQELDVPDPTKALIVREPHKLAAAALQTVNPIPAMAPMTVAEFWHWVQAGIADTINSHLEAIQARAKIGRASCRERV